MSLRSPTPCRACCCCMRSSVALTVVAREMSRSISRSSCSSAAASWARSCAVGSIVPDPPAGGRLAPGDVAGGSTGFAAGGEAGEVVRARDGVTDGAARLTAAGGAMGGDEGAAAAGSAAGGPPDGAGGGAGSDAGGAAGAGGGAPPALAALGRSPEVAAGAVAGAGAAGGLGGESRSDRGLPPGRRRGSSQIQSRADERDDHAGSAAEGDEHERMSRSHLRRGHRARRGARGGRRSAASRRLLSGIRLRDLAAPDLPPEPPPASRDAMERRRGPVSCASRRRSGPSPPPQGPRGTRRPTGSARRGPSRSP